MATPNEMLLTIFQDNDKRIHSVMKSFCGMLKRILKDKIYTSDEIGAIHCYLLRGVVAVVNDNTFNIYLHHGGHRYLLGFVSEKRAFSIEIINEYKKRKSNSA